MKFYSIKQKQTSYKSIINILKKPLTIELGEVNSVDKCLTKIQITRKSI